MFPPQISEVIHDAEIHGSPPAAAPLTTPEATHSTDASELVAAFADSPLPDSEATHTAETHDALPASPKAAYAPENHEATPVAAAEFLPPPVQAQTDETAAVAAVPRPPPIAEAIHDAMIHGSAPAAVDPPAPEAAHATETDEPVAPFIGSPLSDSETIRTAKAHGATPAEHEAAHVAENHEAAFGAAVTDEAIAAATAPLPPQIAEATHDVVIHESAPAATDPSTSAAAHATEFYEPIAEFASPPLPDSETIRTARAHGAAPAEPEAVRVVEKHQAIPAAADEFLPPPAEALHSAGSDETTAEAAVPLPPPIAEATHDAMVLGSVPAAVNPLAPEAAHATETDEPLAPFIGSPLSDSEIIRSVEGHGANPAEPEAARVAEKYAATPVAADQFLPPPAEAHRAAESDEAAAEATVPLPPRIAEATHDVVIHGSTLAAANPATSQAAHATETDEPVVEFAGPLLPDAETDRTAAAHGAAPAEPEAVRVAEKHGVTPTAADEFLPPPAEAPRAAESDEATAEEDAKQAAATMIQRTNRGLFLRWPTRAWRLSRVAQDVRKLRNGLRLRQVLPVLLMSALMLGRAPSPNLQAQSNDGMQELTTHVKTPRAVATLTAPVKPGNKYHALSDGSMVAVPEFLIEKQWKMRKPIRQRADPHAHQKKNPWKEMPGNGWLWQNNLIPQWFPRNIPAPGGTASYFGEGFRQDPDLLSDAVAEWRKVRLWMRVPLRRAGIPAASFLKAAAATADIVDGLGLYVSDAMRDSIRLLEIHVKKSSPKITLEQLITAEIMNNAEAGDIPGAATCELKWLARRLRLWSRASLELGKDPQKSFARCIASGYEASMKHHHTWIQRIANKLGFKTLPTREGFKKIIAGAPDAKLEGQFKTFAEVASPVLERIQKFMVDKGLEGPDK